ncbi:PREDICTED: uncharacterized protein LOC105560903 [Vollenhovia emeryi]|uniref:uncharacterized protein LOC105560903 n=1 Tax=Vollenhovia emeryi TaxID=411798 RepID=UPI0005F4E631|nr:PREDICTED: uncharacterized protein LOC105560903 [Vollenhovia emeryi]
MVQTRIGIVIIIISIVMSVYQDKKFRLSMKRLAAVDDTLERLGTPKIYQKLHTYAKGVLIGWFVCSYVVNVFDMMWWFYATKNYWCMILPYIINHYHHTAMLMDFLLMTFLWYIGTRFDKVNEHVRNLIVKENYGYFWRETIPNTRRYVMCTDYKPVLWTLMHLHLELCQIVRELNTIFGPQMTTELVAHLIFLARLCHLIYKHIRMKSQSMHTIVWLGVSFRVLLQLARLFSFNYICEKISIKVNYNNK